MKVKNLKGPTQIGKREICATIKCLQMCQLINISIFRTTLHIYYLLNEYLLSSIYVLSVGLYQLVKEA